ncbi:DUF357 domain-containing protein [Methanoculleus sp. Afa-1]|uniref:DUF357 domain-containing protein n=1 Tax=Methanoculleus formosensis TaxID=2590886 RepID=A0A9E4ZLS4_9EURY|nr:DUF357 domain-containing protein [Methanoculleus sp. Afa-1]MCT8336670.1 DUF357 domain-containing protein [Methanoculleus sp. Afa-1]
MNLDEYGALYGEALSLARIAVPDGTSLSRAAGEVIEMAAAYHSDGFAFLRAGDRVNALAAFAYGLGWLDAGSRLGLLAPSLAHPPETVDAGIPESQAAHLDEKTHRYRRMLDAALAGVEAAADEASSLQAAAGEFYSAARGWYAQGAACLDAGDRAAALARFSYGYAWLDAGIRAGLFRITGERGLFTV